MSQLNPSSTSAQAAYRRKVESAHAKTLSQVRSFASEKMLAFTKHMNKDYRIHWHHVRIASFLDRFVSGEITRLMIFTPPQVGKSELVSRNLPPFIFGKDPDHRIIGAAYGDSFASEFNIDVQRIMESEKYKQLFPETRIPEDGSGGGKRWVRNSSRFDIVGRKGRYNSVGVGGSLTGKTGYTLLIDDPVKNEEEARSQVYRDRQWRWLKTVARTRLKKDLKGRPNKILLTMTRWHHDDLAGRLIAEMKANPNMPKWTILCFPMLREDMMDPLDPRELDEPLWPEMVSKEECEELKADPRTWNALYQQRPAPEAGAILKREWWKFYKEEPDKIAEIGKQIQSWDLTFTEGKSTDFVVGFVIGKAGPKRYLMDRFRARVGFNGQITAIEGLSARWPKATRRAIEKSANGYAAKQVLDKTLTGVTLEPVEGSKIFRAEAMAPQVQAGNWYLPDPSVCAWTLDFIEECAEFPFGKNDDQVDAWSQGAKILADGPKSMALPLSITSESKWKI